MRKQTRKEELMAMKPGTIKVYRFEEQGRNSLYGMCSLYKRMYGTVFHIETDWENRLLMVTRIQ